jgi:ribonuclease III
MLRQMKSTSLTQFSQKLRYEFKDHDFIEEAFRHSSYVNEQGDQKLRDNERLEFLGDAVLNLVVGHLLMARYPELKEGDLSRMRANLVNAVQLADLARSIDLGTYVQLGKGELLTNGHEKNSILAGAFEAVLAAVYLDGGFEAAFRVIEAHMAGLLEEAHSVDGFQDFKSQLQELAQVTHHQIPAYTVAYENGPDHDKTFGVRLRLCDLNTEGVGKSKKLAEQDAARKALEIIRGQAPKT